MNPLLIQGFGINIKVDKRRLIINDPYNKKITEFHPHQIDHDHLIIDGYTGCISFEALRWLTRHGIHLTLLDWNGNLLGTWQPRETNVGKLRINQYAKYVDDAARYQIAEAIVMEKVKHSANLLQELSSYLEAIDYGTVAKDIAARTKEYWAARGKDMKPDLKRLMLYESHIAILYWNCLSCVFGQLAPQFNFPCRGNQTSSNNMNASDEINAMLNYGYAVLESWVRKYICATGLDQSIGFLHHLRLSNTPLVYDLLELYRWIVDLSVLQLLEDRKLKKSDFIVTEHYHTRLRESTAKLLIGKLQLNFNRRALYKGKQYTYDVVLQDNVQILANHVQDKSDVLQFCVPPVKIGRNDTIDMRETILRMTPEERKKLGINKSTLWYMQKNLREGKRVKIYEKVRGKLDVSD